MVSCSGLASIRRQIVCARFTDTGPFVIADRVISPVNQVTRQAAHQSTGRSSGFRTGRPAASAQAAHQTITVGSAAPGSTNPPATAAAAQTPAAPGHPQ